MKSLSRVNSRTAREEVKTWAPVELAIEYAVSPVDTQVEQMLAIFRNDEQMVGGRQEAKLQPSLSPRMRALTVTAWQPVEIDLQPPLQETNVWNSLDSSNDLDESLSQEIWQEELNPEKEAETVLMQARTQAEEIILEARAAADKVILQAQDEIDSEKQAGYEQGWNEARNELGEALKAVQAVVEEVQQWRDSLTSQGEQILVEMLKDIAQTMFGEGVRLDAEALQVNLNRVMEHAQKLGDLNIFLNRRDAELLDPSWSEYQLLITGNRVKIIPSEKITLGGCIVKGSMGMVDGRVETQLAAVMNAIEETRGAKE